MRVVIYTRVSSEEQVQGTSLDFQERICREYAARCGYEVDRVFSDRGESAKTADRAEFQAMLRYCRTNRGKLGGILVWKTDRFARRNYDAVVYQQMLSEWDIRILSCTESNDETPHNKAMRAITAVINQLDNDYRAERTRQGMKDLAALGYWTHMAPIGYIRIRDDAERPVLIEDPTRAAHVRQVFQMVADGCSISAITAAAKAMGLRTQKGRILTPRDIHETLRNQIYAGIIKTKLTDGREVAAKFQPLVELHLWDRVQLMMSGRGVVQKIHERTREEFPLRGFIRCSECTTKLTASTSKGRNQKYSYYHCPACKAVRVRSEALHEQYRELLTTKTSVNSGRMKLIRHHVMKIWSERKRNAQLEQQLAATNLKHLEATRAALLDKLLAGVITDAIYQDKDSSLALDISEARTKIHAQDIDDMECESALAFAERLVANAAQIWDSLSGTKRQRFQQALFPTGIVYDPKSGVRTAQSQGIIGMIEHLSDKNTEWGE